MKRILEPEVMQTIEEVGAFDKIAAKLGWVLHNPLVNLFLSMIEAKDQSTLTVLDIGTGTASVPLKIIEKKDLKIYCLDFSANMLKTASEKINPVREAVFSNGINPISKNIVLIRADAKRLPFKNHCFDAVISSNFFHHLGSPFPVLREIDRVVKPEGFILIRDMLRPPAKFILNLYVWIANLLYSHDAIMKKEYRDSLYAAWTVSEWRETLASSPLKNADFFSEFPHYITIVKR